MKKLSLALMLMSLFFSCNNDDDQITVPECITPYNLTETNITYQSAIAHWEDDNVDAVYKIEFGVSGFQLGTGQSFTIYDNSYLFTGLSANTTYDYYVKTICDISNESILSSVKSFTTLPNPVIPEFKPTLSELNLFSGNLSNLQPSTYTFEYELHSALYTDYAHKQRLIALPLGEEMIYNGDDLPLFPDNTVIAKTFYYNVDDRDESLGRNIIETRILIKLNGEWEAGNYVWNEAQTEAYLDNDGLELPVSWIDNNGDTKNVNYKVPSYDDCFTCHQTYGAMTPIGPKLRTLNFSVDDVNQLQALKDRMFLAGLSDPSTVSTLPNWEDTSLSTQKRVRAYFDVNCAHCHSAGGFHNESYYEALNLDYESDFEDTFIYERRYSIMARIQTSIEGYSMPFIGVTTPHQEALDLIIPYLETLE